MNPRHLRVLPRASSAASATLRPFPRFAITRLYTTQSDLGNGSGKFKRRNITVLSDDGRYTWGELSGREKLARATQQSFNFIIVIAGVVLTVGMTQLSSSGPVKEPANKCLTLLSEFCRVVSSRFFIRMSSHQIAGHGNSRKRSTALKTMLDVQSFWVTEEKSRHMVRIRRADGHEIDLLRKLHSAGAIIDAEFG